MLKFTSKAINHCRKIKENPSSFCSKENGGERISEVSIFIDVHAVQTFPGTQTSLDLKEAWGRQRPI